MRLWASIVSLFLIAPLIGSPVAGSSEPRCDGALQGCIAAAAPPDIAVGGTITRGAPVQCTGDCDGNRDVSTDELIRGVNIALGRAPIDGCAAFDIDDSSSIGIDELAAAVNAAIGSCGAAANTPTATQSSSVAGTGTPTASPTASATAHTPTTTQTATVAASDTPTASPTASATAPTSTATQTAPAPATDTPTASPTATATETVIPIATRTRTPGTFCGASAPECLGTCPIRRICEEDGVGGCLCVLINEP